MTYILIIYEFISTLEGNLLNYKFADNFLSFALIGWASEAKLVNLNLYSYSIIKGLFLS